jgi:hypothetical protein
MHLRLSCCLGLSVITALSACSDTTAPINGLKFCYDQGWFSYKNDGGDWKFVTPTSGTLSFDATDKLTIAFSQFTTDATVFSLTRDELSQLSGTSTFGCSQFQATSRTLHGTVTGLALDESYFISVPSGSAAGPTPTFAVSTIDSAIDLVAVATALTSSSTAHRAIIRRGLDLPGGSAIPLLDFSSAEAQPIDSAALTITNLNSNFPATFASTFRTGSITRTLRQSSGSAPTSIYAMPAALLAANDINYFTINECPSQCTRTLVAYYRKAQPATLALGPAHSNGTATIVSSTPCTRFTIDIPVQAEYGAYGNASVTWGTRPVSSFSVTVTSAYLGATPAASWHLEVPDLARPDGSCLIPASVQPSGFVTVASSFLPFTNTPGTDGQVVLSATGSAIFP